jgi:pantoate--beta-alanine ligase
MKTFQKIADTNAYLQRRKTNGQSIGFVPTMGALHEGHLELMRKARQENDVLTVSIFVNPIQFNDPGDLEKYPRDLDADKQLLESVDCDLLFYPEIGEMYPEEVHKTFDFDELETVMEGAFRAGHFNGVAVVVEKLFDIIQPNKAYFGEKDFQQLAIIRRLVEMENLPVEIVPCPIVREADGLAMSSRNARLTESERAMAPTIYQTLLQAREKSAEMRPDEVRCWVENKFKDIPGFRLEYFELANEQTLQPVDDWPEQYNVRGFIAVFLGKVRLIDNIRFI